jgi:hypothetical protein
MQGAGPSRPAPFSVGGTLNAAFELYQRQAVALWTTTAIVVVPTQILIWIIVRASLPGGAYARNGTIYTSGSAAPATVAVLVLGFISAILTMGALSRLLAEAYTGHASTWQQSLRYAGRQLGPLLWLGIVSVIALGIGYTLLVIPGVFLTVAWSLAVPVLVFEASPVLGALRRSWQLVQGYWWTTFGALLLALGIIVGISFLIEAIFSAIASSSSIAVLLTLSGLGRAVADILAYPLVAAVCVVIYVDLRSQKEGVSPESLIPSSATVPSRGPITRY